MPSRSHTKNAGFTLIELLVVIAIVGLLSSVLLASLSAAQQRSKDLATEARVHQLKLILSQYEIDYGGYPNPAQVAGTYYCVGMGNNATCKDPDGNTITTTLAVLDDYFQQSAKKTSIGNFLLPKVEAFTVNERFAEFVSNPPLVFQCTVASNPCSPEYAWIYAWLGPLGQQTIKAYAANGGSGTSGIY
jgi:prepilin-type N-terminal cleavage/methylation domain-containing protein